MHTGLYRKKLFSSSTAVMCVESLLWDTIAWTAVRIFVSVRIHMSVSAFLNCMWCPAVSCHIDTILCVKIRALSLAEAIMHAFEFIFGWTKRTLSLTNFLVGRSPNRRRFAFESWIRWIEFWHHCGMILTTFIMYTICVYVLNVSLIISTMR